MAVARRLQSRNLRSVTSTDWCRCRRRWSGDAHRLRGIAAVLIHGRLDLSGPLRTAWELAQAWPDADLKIIEDTGHTGSPAMGAAVIDAIARFHPTRSHY